jgi:hypothetical protein
MRPEPFPKLTRPLRLRMRLSKHLPRTGGVRRLKFVLRAEKADLVEFQRLGECLSAILVPRDQFGDDRINFYYRAFLPVVVHVLSRSKATVNDATAALTDGSSAKSKHLVFSANYPDALLIPDPEFFNSNAYGRFRRMSGTQLPWRDRADAIVWRGSTTGSGRLPANRLDAEAADIRPRARMCALLRSIPNVDAKLIRVVQSDDLEGDTRRLTDAGLMGGPIETTSWLNRKFAIDIDGNTNAWSNLFTRLLAGCCVIKIDSQHGFRQWYYDRLVPWKTHVPVQAGFSDLIEKIEWCRTNPAECAHIAATGRALALSMTLQTEISRAIDRVNEVLGR